MTEERSGHTDCQQVIADLATFLDNEDDELSHEEIAAHLADCPPCRDKADLEECVREVLRSRCADKAPRSLIESLEAALVRVED